MKIGIDARFYRKSTGGIGRYTRALLRELSKIDQDNEYLIYITPEDDAEYDIKAKNFKKVVVPIVHYSVSEQIGFLSVLNKDKLDLVHFTNFNHPVFYSGKFVVTIHDLTMMLYPAGGVQKSLIKKTAFQIVMKNAVKKASTIIAISQATKKDLINILHTKSNKIAVIYEGIDAAYKPKGKLKTQNIEQYGIRKPYLLFISQWRPHKGIIQLVKGFELLKDEYKIPHQLVVAGKPNPDFPEIFEAIHKSPYVKDVITPGFVAEDNLPGLYKNADLFVFPSHYEGFGLPPLEAMASGVPVASSNASCMPEILGDAASYFDPNNPVDMAKSVYSVLSEQSGDRENRIKKGFEQVKKYSWSKMAQETSQVYKEILS